MKRATNATITTRILSTTGLKQPKVCRTCFKTTDVFHYIDQRDGKESVFIREKIQSCVPEMDLYASERVVVCSDCLEAIRSFYNFKRKCVDIETSIRSYIEHHSVSNSKTVMLSDVVREFPIKGLYTDSLPRKKPARTLQKILPNNVETIMVLPVLPVEIDLENTTNNEVDPLSINNPVPEPRPEQNVMYKCLLCPYETEDKSVLEFHVCTETEPAEVVVRSVNSPEPDDDGLQINSEVPAQKCGEWYLCHRCPFRTIDLNILQCHHRNIHHNKNILRCPHCGYWTTDPITYNIHQEAEHTEVKCPICRYLCSSGVELNCHMRTKHPKSKVPLKVQR